MSNINLKGNGSFADPSLLGKNYILNPEMAIWQRGIAPGSGGNNNFSADRWYTLISAGTPDMQRIADGPAGFRYCLRIKQTTANSAYGRMRYRFESKETVQLAGKPFTVQWWAKSTQNSVPGVGGGSITTRYYSAGEDTFTGGTTDIPMSWIKTQTVSSSWQQYAMYGVFPASLTINDAVELLFDTASGFLAVNNDEIRWTGVQLHIGYGIQPLYSRSLGEELTLCQRYYEKNYGMDIVPGTASISDNAWMSVAANTSQISGAKYRVIKRAIPTVTLYAYTGASATLTFTDSNASVGAGTSVSSSHTDGGWFTTGPGGVVLTKGNGYFYHWTAQAELL